ncbi:MAG TPA: hypothetical protein VHB54_17930, partial [Mucilaginibacter sp.]|nr:hypothetical protein [Mucilaginibacter sp.]
MKRLSISFCVVLFFSCQFCYAQHTVNPEAKKLTDSAQMLGETRWALKHMPRVTRDSLYRMKLTVLNKAIHIDGDYFEAIYYKFILLDQLKDDRGALVVAKRALQLKPNASWLKYSIGLAYDRIGDSVAA